MYVIEMYNMNIYWLFCRMLMITLYYMYMNM